MLLLLFTLVNSAPFSAGVGHSPRTEPLAARCEGRQPLISVSMEKLKNLRIATSAASSPAIKGKQRP